MSFRIRYDANALRSTWIAIASLTLFLTLSAAAQAGDGVFIGRVFDASSKPMPSRIYVERKDGERYFVQVADKAAEAIPYERVRGSSSTRHTSVSAHEFRATLPAGEYTVTAERGKEYVPMEAQVVIRADKTTKVELRLRRWIDMSKRSWFSGDTHVHRELKELPLLMHSEDLNVAFPLTAWTRYAFAVPDDPGAEEPEKYSSLIKVDDTHVIWPRNTEYEIFTTKGQSHTLGAVFLLGHKKPFSVGAPPLTPIANATREQNGLIELDKHNWPWSMAIIPIMKVDLFELSNNHIWRAPFSYGAWGEKPAAYMNCERDGEGVTEWGWINFGFENYYALLDCGFRLRPTAGTASGVHPVPLGFGRVYVQCPEGFSYANWMKGLNRGRSFVTTGPMLFVEVNGKKPGEHFDRAGTYKVDIEAISDSIIDSIEVVVNGKVMRKLIPEISKNGHALHSKATVSVHVESSSWIAVRAIDRRDGGRVRFAHSAPVFIDVPGRPLRPRAEEVDYLVKRVKDQIVRSGPLLPEAALEEYRSALRAYESLRQGAR